ncbi:FlgO family outer membrane protein [Teredinibacter haidensis]|uniref:FlgO family outer membrane protein n=1 Tax=Teredinibacter haidensis TaxID=2731755 RepID=UPI0009489CC1|nr:FlgO family outer membrane protein [Teredinibacter haidensis]
MIKQKLIGLCHCLFAGILLLTLSQANAAGNLDEGVKDLAKQISVNMKGNNKRKIAVIEFSNLNDEVSAFGQFLAEELITQLYMLKTDQFEVVERRQLLKVLNEQGLGTSGLLDADAMSQVGKILGVDAIVTGSVTNLGNTVKVNARMISVTTAKIFAVAATNIPKVGTVSQLMDKKAKKVKSASSGSVIKATSENAEKPKHGIMSISTNILTLSLDSCEKNGTSVVCTVYARNDDENNDLDIYVYAKSGGTNARILDNYGRETLANNVSIGGKSSGRYFIHTFVAGVSTPIVYTFNSVASDASSISLFDMHFNANNKAFNGKLRKIHL